ncbi:MAG TPA: hypothetical protein VJ697_16985 [Nitrososphaeraceae archaeon]|nr:hypothetical protein [Nitrososphaeraceae archaeon]
MCTFCNVYGTNLKPRKNNKKNKKKRDKDKVNPIPNKETKVQKEGESPKIKLPEPIIYDLSDISRNQQRNIRLVKDDNNSLIQQQQVDTTDAKEITYYYITFHKNMINTYNSIFSKMLQGISNSYYNSFLTCNERFADYSTEIENVYNSINGNRDKSFKLIDDIITKNLDTFIKSIELTQKFYNDIIQSYLYSIKTQIGNNKK